MVFLLCFLSDDKTQKVNQCDWVRNEKANIRHFLSGLRSIQSKHRSNCKVLSQSKLG